jgi:hypothetical protein
MSVAETILAQLGGRRFVAMTGSSGFVSDGYTLRMRLAKNASKANRLDITLTPMDTYTMRFYRYTAPRMNSKTYEWSDAKVTEVAEYEDVYCDMLQDIFTSVTGMYTRL